jgi:hypothetical protein
MRREILSLCAFLGISLLITSGCTSDLHSIEGRILFKVYEGHSSDDLEGQPRIILELRTEKIYCCCNNRIISDVTRSGGYIAVHLKGVLFPELCLTSLGPAMSRDFLDLPEGAYSLNFRQWSSSDKYTLTVRKDAIEIDPGVTNFTAAENLLFWRYPENSFAYYCGTMTETAWVCDDFLSHLIREIDLDEFCFPDYGKIPYSRSSQGHYYDAAARYFRYKTEDDFHRAGEVLAAYSREVIVGMEGIGLCLKNWKNKNYCSWLFQAP